MTAPARRIVARRRISIPTRFCCAGSITGSRAREISRASRASAISFWVKIAGATPTEFPLEANHVLYLHGDGRANSRKGKGTLSASAPFDEKPSDIFIYDPEVPVPAPGGPAAPSGPFDQAALELGNNLLVYTTAPLARELLVFGTPRVSLFCATSAAHTDFTAKLVRVRPNGVADFICIGIARSSFLFAKSGYAADKIHHWQFDLEPTSCAFAAGDRIRLEIASSAFPLYDRNPGSGVPSPLASSWDWRRSTQIVHHSSVHPSALYLPVSEPSA